MSDLKISVITPSYNQGEFIKDTIESVLAQNYPNFEHIVIDGGSTDNTVQILQSYPHLKWVSEKDRGQTDALNKGLALSSGDIIAWINSDDWYAPNTFNKVVEALKDYPIVMGACCITDRNGKPSYEVPNIERSWYDLLKYWVSYSIPTQPSIFFLRGLIEEIKQGSFLDEQLHYVMDFELWLRMAKKYPLTKRIPEVLSYYRIYEENKTGQGMKPLEPEMSRVFKRHADALYAVEHRITFVIPCTEVNSDLERTLDTIALQTVKDYEVLLVGYGDNEQKIKAIKDYAKKEGAARCGAIPSFVDAKGDFITALNTVLSHTHGSIITFLEPGSVLSSNSIVDTINIFQVDRVALALPLKGDSKAKEHFFKSGPIDIGKIFSSPLLPFNFSIRKVAMHELGGIRYAKEKGLALRELMLRLIYKGWSISENNALNIVKEGERSDCAAEVNMRGNATLIVELEREFQEEPFASVRVGHNYGLRFSDETVSQARQTLQLAL